MTSRKHWWLLVPLAAAVGCAGSQQEQRVTKAGGNSTLVDEGPASEAQPRPEQRGLSLLANRRTVSSFPSRVPTASPC